MLAALLLLFLGCGMTMTGPEPTAAVDPAAPAALAPAPPDTELTDAAPEPPAPEESADPEELLRTCERIAAKLGSVSLEDCTGSD